MNFKVFTVGDLETARRSDDFWRAGTLPITRQKALSFCRNPRAEPNDPVLMIACQDRRVVAYLGILPDRIFSNDSGHKMGWLTGWWVDPSLAKGMGAMLLYKALNLYPGIGVSGGSKPARKVLHASQQFVALPSLKGLEMKIRFNAAGTLIGKLASLKHVRFLLRFADVVLDEIADLRRSWWERENPVFRRLTFEYVRSIDEETSRFIARRHRDDLTRKGKADLDWIMTYPWIVAAPQKDPVSRRYYFSSIAARFSYLGVKVSAPDAGLVGFLLLNVRNDRMAVLYSYFDPPDGPSIATAAVSHALAMDVNTLSLYDERLVESVSGLNCPRWSIRPVSRGFFLSKSLAHIPSGERRLHGGDGDFAFY
jgi:hypothetical protein